MKTLGIEPRPFSLKGRHSTNRVLFPNKEIINYYYYNYLKKILDSPFISTYKYLNLDIYL